MFTPLSPDLSFIQQSAVITIGFHLSLRLGGHVDLSHVRVIVFKCAALAKEQ